MDTLAHSLWAYAVGGSAKLKHRWIILGLVSAGPDIVWLPFTIYDFLLRRGIHFHTIPYELSHSLVLWLAISLIVSLKWGRAFTWTWPWAFHILIDIPGHVDMPTPFLWPVSHFTIRGAFDWLSPKLLLLNYFTLAVVFFFLWLRDRRKLFDKHITS